LLPFSKVAGLFGCGRNALSVTGTNWRNVGGIAEQLRTFVAAWRRRSGDDAMPWACWRGLSPLQHMANKRFRGRVFATGCRWRNITNTAAALQTATTAAVRTGHGTIAP